MATYSDMRARIADELANDGDISTNQINYAIQDAIKSYERREWWWNSYIGTFNTVANQEYYSSTDFPDLTNAFDIKAMTVTYNSIQIPMKAVDYVSISDVQSGVVKSVPRVFAYFDQQIRMYPIPIGAYPITVSYVTRLTALSADSDSNAWTNEAEELIRQSAKRRIALNYLQSEEVAARFAGMEQEAYSDLLAEFRRRQPNTMLRSPAMLDHTRFNIITG